MIVHEDFAFYHMNKCGGTSVIKMLDSLGLKFKQIGEKHGAMFIKNYDISDLTIYSNIRNPFARIVSMYETRKQFSRRMLFKKNSITFKDFFYDWWLEKTTDPFRPMHEHLFIDDELPENMILVKLEDIDSEWPRIIKKHFNREIGDVPRENATIQNGHYMNYYNDSMIADVNKKEWWAVEQYA